MSSAISSTRVPVTLWASPTARWLQMAGRAGISCPGRMGALSTTPLRAAWLGARSRRAWCAISCSRQPRRRRGGGGTVQADTTGVDIAAGVLIPENRTTTLTATPTSAPLFCGWIGDTTAAGSSLVLGMRHPYTVAADFGSSPAITSAGARPDGVMGAVYADTLRISGGGSTMVWTVTGGALPTGVTLDAATGRLSGFPRQAGDFSYQAQVASCGTLSRTFTLSVTVPTLATADVTAQLLGPTSPLTEDQLRYLDFLGNNNGFFDIGDFLAWVKATGAPLSPAVQAAQRKGGRR